MTALSELLEAHRQGVSARSVARRAQELGFTLNHDTAARYFRGDHGRPDEPTLQALAAALDVPLVTLREAADLPSEQTEPYVPPAEASRLNRRQRKAVDEIIRAMLETSSGVTPSSVIRQLGTEPATGRRAARRGKGERSPG